MKSCTLRAENRPLPRDDGLQRVDREQLGRRSPEPAVAVAQEDPSVHRTGGSPSRARSAAIRARSSSKWAVLIDVKPG